MLSLRFLLRLLVARQPSHGTADCATDTIAHALAQVTELTLCLLTLAGGILLLALLLQTLGADEAANSLLGCAHGLVPAALLAGWVVGCDALGADGDAADGATGLRGKSVMRQGVVGTEATYVGEGVLGLGLALLVGGLLVVRGATSHTAQRALNCTSGAVDVRLEGGSVLE